MAYSAETFIRIYDDKTGEHVQVGPDADGLDCVEISQREQSGKIEARITIQPEQALLLAKAILELYAPKPSNQPLGPVDPLRR